MIYFYQNCSSRQETGVLHESLERYIQCPAKSFVVLGHPWPLYMGRDFLNLSRLKKIDLREVWKHEALDFTNWLAQDENLQLLSEEIGIDINLIQTEASVGRFNVDILAEQENTGKKIVIENQLEVTDHDHLGKIITYASGFDAEIIIWIVKDVRDEHKQAVDWLNEHTDSRINIFALEMEIWQIGESPYAPKFNIISKPNDWAKAVKQSSSGKSELSDRKMMQLEFWTQFKEFTNNRKSILKTRKPYPQHWYDISTGNSKSHLSLIVDADNDQIRCEYYIPDSMELYYALVEQKEIIQQKLEYELEWMELEGKKASRIRAINEIHIIDQENWNQGFQWLLESAENFLQVFSSVLKTVTLQT